MGWQGNGASNGKGKPSSFGKRKRQDGPHKSGGGYRANHGGSSRGTGGGSFDKRKRRDGPPHKSGGGYRSNYKSGSNSDGADGASNGGRSVQRRERKEFHKMRRQPQRFALMKDVLMQWETLRSNKTSKEDRTKIVSSILSKCEGRIAELATSHKASRIVQACLKHGGDAHRKQIIEELRPEIVALSMNQFGHFLVKKVVSQSKAELAHALKAMRGRVVALLRHPCGASVVDVAYEQANPRQREQLAAEFYGPEVALIANLGTDELSLSSLLSRATPSQRASMLTHMYTKLSPIMDKGLVDAEIMHVLIRNYLDFAAAGAIHEAADLLAGPHLLHMLHTRDGAAACVSIVCASNAKNRKKIVRALKGHVVKCATEQHGHVVLLALLSFVDDTVLMGKIVGKELAAQMSDVCMDKYGRRVVLHLIAPSKGHLPPQTQEVLKPSKRTIEASHLRLPSAEYDSEEEEEEEEEENGGGAMEEGGEGVNGEKKASKKPLETKCQELLFGASKLAAALTKVCKDEAEAMLCSPHASDILTEVALLFESGAWDDAVGADAIRAVPEAVAALVREAASKESFEGTVLDNFYGTRALRDLVGASCEQGTGAFASMLWDDGLDGGSLGKKLENTHAEKLVRALDKRPKKKTTKKKKK